MRLTRISLIAVVAALLLVSVSLVAAKPRYSSAQSGTASSAKFVDHKKDAGSNSESDTASTSANHGGGGASVKLGEKDLLEDMLRESDVLNLLEQEQKKHEKRLKELQNRLEKELQQVQEHFESVMTKLKKTEDQLELNLKNVEKSLLQQVKSSHERTENVSSAWKWPFFILLVLLAGLGGFFGQLYRKATKGMRML